MGWPQYTKNLHDMVSVGAYGKSVAKWTGVLKLLVVELQGIQTAIMLVKAGKHWGKSETPRSTWLHGNMSEGKGQVA